MSRIPQASSSRPTVKTTLAPPASRSRAPSPSKSATSTPSTPRVRTKSVPKSPSKSIRRPPVEEEPPVPKPALSIKEAIALKRAETRKAVAAVARSGFNGFDQFDNLEDAIPGPIAPKKDEDANVDLGRWSVKETIERARSTGSINLSSRSLPCLPSALFEIHLSVTPDALKSVPHEPPITTSEVQGRRVGQRDGPAWFEAQDLQVLKAWNNEIVELQHEISLFGSLKNVDLHQNKLTSLPDTFADLTALTTLDLSHNSLTSLPANIFALPTLTNLNLSHNSLSTLPFGQPFSKDSSAGSRIGSYGSGGFFGPVITRATTPLPRLLALDVSFNKLVASAIDYKNFPSSITKFDLSSNPIASGNSESYALVKALGALRQLKELRFAHADIADDAFQPTLASEGTELFPTLRVLDLEETHATEAALQSAFSGLKQQLLFDMTTDEPPEGTLRILVGKKILKEAWELEAERRARSRGKGLAQSTNIAESSSKTSQPREELVKEPWEIEAEQGLLTEGGRRRARAAAAAAPTQASSTSPSETKRDSLVGMGRPSTPSGTSPSSTVNLNNTQYYDAHTQTLTLPPLALPAKSHVRSFSLAASALSPSCSQGKIDIALPTPTLPIAAIATQSFAQSLRILILSNRKLDLSVSLPVSSSDPDVGLLPNLEELVLDGCGFGDQAPVVRQVDGGSPPPKSTESLLPFLTRLFPNLRTLDLSYNALTSTALEKEVLLSLIMASSQDLPTPRKGLRHLRLRGNRITSLDGFQQAAEIFKGHRTVPDWKLEELDLRDNEISKLPAELGLLPLEVLLVDGNVFRIPQRRVWEREGTKGLLSWLRGRLE